MREWTSPKPALADRSRSHLQDRVDAITVHSTRAGPQLDMRSFRSLPVLGTALSVSLVAGANAQGHFEQPNDKPAPVTHPVEAPIAVKSRVVIQRGPITSYQINVNNQGNNRPNDAANEPSIAINPNDPNNMVAGWRQFDSINSDFRENGWAYTTDGGITWTNPGAITEGTFYSDPVIDTDDAGNFYYLSYPGGTTMTVFRSGDGGARLTGYIAFVR